MAKIVIVEDNQEVRDGWEYMINSVGKHKVVNSYETTEDFLCNLNHDNPDLILMDINLPGMNGIDGTRLAKEKKPNLSIMIISVFENSEMVFDAICAGAVGYLVKNSTPEELFLAIDQLLAGGSPMSTQIARMVVGSFHKSAQSPLSPRETEVLSGLAKGKSYTDLARDLCISKETAKSHIKKIYQKLEVSSKAEAIHKANKEKLLDWKQR